MDQENSEKDVDTYNRFFGAEVCLPDKLGKKIIARVLTCVKDNKGNPRGSEHQDSFADHSLYEVLFPNGQMEELTLNIISENMLSKVDSEGHH